MNTFVNLPIQLPDFGVVAPPDPLNIMIWERLGVYRPNDNPKKIVLKRVHSLE